ncbi:hypothetical protein MPTA5024_18340 [Microbispora sp. ATCC PTA-5024]|nr:hypothetical protein [Microbispora sp. ATCC PTA-5024]ETK34634.1 hypothetical protein MPTA5024_18340 [Microbispora sp. ATCC PTA-5024]
MGRLRESGARGRLHPDLAAALAADSRLVARLARVLLDANFEPSLHADICLLTGLDVDGAEAGGRLRTTSSSTRACWA